ncbi:MAG: hypothetical protein PVJ39_04920 [Gammaproteobacteria bacterium]|jgi:hypothetical protein
MFRLVLAVLLLLLMQTAIAECQINGQTYQPGDVVAGFVCTESGRWVKVGN